MTCFQPFVQPPELLQSYVVIVEIHAISILRHTAFRLIAVQNYFVIVETHAISILRRHTAVGNDRRAMLREFRFIAGPRRLLR